MRDTAKRLIDYCRQNNRVCPQPKVAAHYTGKHIARGLHFSFCGQPLPPEYKLFVHSKPGYDSIDFFVPQFTSFYEKCSAHRQGYVGDVFSFVAASAGNAYAWLMLLYDYFWWIVIAVPPDFEIPGETVDGAGAKAPSGSE